MSIFRQHVTLGKETVYGVPVTPTRSYDVRTDSWSLETERINTDGFYRNRQAMRDDRDRIIVLGATGTIETTIYDGGMGYILQDLLGDRSGPTEGTGSEAGTFTTTISSSPAGPSGSYTIQVVRAQTPIGTMRPATYSGCVPVSWNISCSVGEDLRLTIDFDAEEELLTTAEATAAYTGLDVPYVWEDVQIRVDGSDLFVASSFSFDADLGLKTDRRFLQGTSTKSQPVRSQQPEYTGTIEAEYTSETHDMYQDFIRGDDFSVELVATSPAGNIGSTSVPRTFKLTLPTVKFTGETPNMSLDDLTMISLPFMAFHDGTADAVTIETVSEESAL